MKRAFDVFFSATGLLLLSPLFVILSLLAKLQSRGPVFFAHERMGKDFKPFSLYKFRTMHEDAQKSGPPVTVGKDSRITTLGRFLRKTKMDELPQLLNVLKGDMSFVGPRPEVRKYVEVFKQDYRNILNVKPGITDFSAIEFRNEESILGRYADPEEGYIREVLPAKIVLYKKYLDERGLFTDVKLILKTLYKIVK